MAEIVVLGLIAVNECGECKDSRCGDTGGSGDNTMTLQKYVLDCQNSSLLESDAYHHIIDALGCH